MGKGGGKEVYRMKVLLVAGARPNFVKLYPLYYALKSKGINPLILHTGQHYDYELSQAFFEDFNLPKPDFYLGVGSDTNIKQISKIISMSEDILKDIKPDLTVVFGDVNSTLAISVATKHLYYNLAHVEAGLRSRDWSMPEEINRVVTDTLSDFLFSPSFDATENLLKEGKPPDRIFTVGNIMIDSLIYALPLAKKLKLWEKMGFKKGKYIVITLHRPVNVDNPQRLKTVIEYINEVSKKYPAIFPMHPRTKKMLDKMRIRMDFVITQPLRYTEFLSLVVGSGTVITDSGGVQEETSFLGIPCITLRPNTERPVTLKLGTNTLVNNPENLLSEISKRFGKFKETRIPLWDGKTSLRISRIIKSLNL